MTPPKTKYDKCEAKNADHYVLETGKSYNEGENEEWTSNAGENNFYFQAGERLSNAGVTRLMRVSWHDCAP